MLRSLIESEANNSANWLKDNRMCVAADKSRLLTIGTKKLKCSTRFDNFSINIDQQEITASNCEKLLGVMIDDDLTWRSQLHGEGENEGLIVQLSKRLGIMKQLKKYMSKDKLKLFANGIFYSKLIYCLPAFGNVFGLDQYRDNRPKYVSFTKRDKNKLQVLQNKLNRLILNAPSRTSTAELLNEMDALSIQQLIAYHTVVTAKKILISRKPSYLAQRLVESEKLRTTRVEGSKFLLPKYSLCSSREGFLYRSIILLNKMGQEIYNIEKIDRFKQEAKKWIRQHVPIKPT